MTNELEKQFFQCFGIEPKCQNTFINPSKCPFNKSKECCDCVSFEYPQITDRILLELICILTKRFDYADQNWLTKCNDIEELKVSVLRLLSLCTSSIIEKYKHQVRTLFEEV